MPSHSSCETDSDPFVTSVSDLDLPDVIPEHDEYSAMPRSLRHVLTPPTPDPSARPRSILLEPSLSHVPSSPYSRPRRSPSDGGASRARQSVSSIVSSSTVHSPITPIRSILTRRDSGISMATTTKSSSRRKKRRSPPSVKFVDAPTVHYDNAVHHNAPLRSPSYLPSQTQQPARWFTRWWRRSSTLPTRPPISGPYHLSYAASLVDVYASTPPRQKPGRLRQLWNRLTGVLS